MGILFEPYDADGCCLCGSRKNLTGEHKIKASALRAIFGNEPMVIGHFDGQSEPRSAQGPKSRAIHFSARLCAPCNSERTQAADKEFDRFHREASALLQAGKDPAEAFTLRRYRVGTEPYLNLFRYFAKLIACHLAESGGPRAIQICDFARGETTFNPVKLRMDADPTYRQFAELSGEHNFAAHGGLIVNFSRKSGLPTGFHTALTLGPLRYVFFVEFGLMVGLALKVFHSKFFNKCEAAFRAALHEPIPDHKLEQLGL